MTLPFLMATLAAKKKKIGQNFLTLRENYSIPRGTRNQG